MERAKQIPFAKFFLYPLQVLFKNGILLINDRNCLLNIGIQKMRSLAKCRELNTYLNEYECENGDGRLGRKIVRRVGAKYSVSNSRLGSTVFFLSIFLSCVFIYFELEVLWHS